MRRTFSSRTLASIAGALVIAGCAAPSADRERTTQNYGYEWAGSGEPTNFGADYASCRREVSYEAGGQMGAYGAFGAQPTRTDPATARRLRSCMDGRGWRTVDR